MIIDMSDQNTVNKPNNRKNNNRRIQNNKQQYQDIKYKRNYKPNYYPKKDKPSMKVSFLGGLNQIGRNMTVFECEGDMFILDCGMSFPDGEMPGVDLVIPDFTYIEANKDKIKGIVITHGHEDHIGALPYLLKNINIPIYGTLLTLGIVTGKLKEHKLDNKAKLNVIKPGQMIKLGCMGIEFIHVNHSIPDSVGIAIHSPAGVLVHTGDFKIDCTPTQGGMIDLARFAELGKKGVLALFADSTNAERSGYTMTEQNIKGSFEALFKEAEEKRIVIATFASNIGRIQQIIDCAIKFGRKVAFSGRSMVNYLSIASELGYVKIPKGTLIDMDKINLYPKNEVLLLTTGSQGEPMSALYRMAYSDHKKIEVGEDDFIIISANPIPGNEKMVSSVINELMKLGCRVVYESMYEVHVSGHACREELKIIQGLTKPKFFIPVHGEQRHLRKHAEIARSMGMSESNIFVGDNGDCIELNRSGMKILKSVPAGKVLVDGLGVGDVGNIVLKDRKKLAEDGLIVVVVTLSHEDGRLISGPDIVSRGFVYVRESEPLMDNVRKIVLQIFKDCSENNIREWGIIKARIKDDLSKLFYNKTRRNPMVLPIIMEA